MILFTVYYFVDFETVRVNIQRERERVISALMKLCFGKCYTISLDYL